MISGRLVLKLLGLIFVVTLLALMNVSDVHQHSLNRVLILSQHFTNSVILQPVETIQEIINDDSSKLVKFYNMTSGAPSRVLYAMKWDQSGLGSGRTDLMVNWDWSWCAVGGMHGGVEYTKS